MFYATKTQRTHTMMSSGLLGQTNANAFLAFTLLQTQQTPHTIKSKSPYTLRSTEEYSAFPSKES